MVRHVTRAVLAVCISESGFVRRYTTVILCQVCANIWISIPQWFAQGIFIPEWTHVFDIAIMHSWCAVGLRRPECARARAQVFIIWICIL